MFSGPLDAASLTRGVTEGLPLGADKSALFTARLVGLDTVNRLAQVNIGGTPVWVPAMPDIYPNNGLVRVMRSPLDGQLLCLGPLEGQPPVVAGEVVSVNSGDGTLTVETLGDTYDLPYVAGTYTGGTWVHVLRAANLFGEPVIVSGPQGNFAGANPAAPGGGAGNTGQGVLREAVLVPTWSGSWKSSGSRWDSWNLDRYGGRSTLWQGNGYGSGSMVGLAVYGDQIAALNAVQITRIQVQVWRADSSSSAGKVATLQPATNGGKPAGAPTTGGATVSTPALAPGQGALVDLPSSVLEGFRDGTYKGVATVGSDYAGFSGPPSGVNPTRADGMALRVQYRVVA